MVDQCKSYLWKSQLEMGAVKFSHFINVYFSKQLQREPDDGINKTQWM